MTKTDNKITKLTDLDHSDKDFRENLKEEIRQRLTGVEHKQVIAFALRSALRTARSLQDLIIKDTAKLDRYYFYYLRASTAALAVYLKFDTKKKFASFSAASDAYTSSSSAYIAAASATSAAASATSAAATAYTSAAASAYAATSSSATTTSASAAATSASSASASASELEILLTCLDNDLLIIEKGVNILELPLWIDQNQKEFSLTLKRMDDFWLDYLFKPAFAGTLLSEQTQHFIDAFLSIEEEVFATKSADAMAEAMREYMADKVVKYNEARLVLLGNGGAGKTSLVRLLNGEDVQVSEKPTPRVSVSQLKIKEETQKGSKKEKREMTLNIWDFGGQVIMHSTHSFFISNKSCYLLVCNQRGNEQPDSWLDMIVARMGNKTARQEIAKQTMIIVYSHCDNKDSSSEVPWRRDNAINRKYAAMLNLQFFNLNMDPSTAKDKIINDERFKALEKSIHKQAFIEGNKTVGASIDNIKQYAQACEKDHQPYITYQQLKTIVKQTKQIKGKLTEDKILLRLEIANNFGYIFPEKPIKQDDNGRHKLDDDFIFVNQSHWLTYGIYELVNSKQAQKMHGILSPSQFNKALHINKTKYIKNNGEIKGAKPKEGDFDQVKYDAKGIKVLKRIIINYKWGFIYHRRMGEMLLPLATSIDEPKDLGSYFSKDISTDHYMELVLDNKPRDFFFRLATYLEPHLNTEEHLWRTGAIIYFYNDKSTQAILEMPNNTLKLTTSGKDKENFLQLLLININETLKHYKNIRAQVFERMNVSKKDKQPVRYEMISSGLIEGLLSNDSLIQTIKDKLLSRSTTTVSNITNNFGSNNDFGSGNNFVSGDKNKVDNHAQINASAESLLGLLEAAKQAANPAEEHDIESLSQELTTAINETDQIKKESLFKRAVANVEKLNTLAQASDTLGRYMPEIVDASMNLSKALGFG